MKSQIILSVFVSTFAVPCVAGWTIGGGLLNQLYFKDEGACLCLHITSGMIAMLICMTLRNRVGHVEPLILKK